MARIEFTKHSGACEVLYKTQNKRVNCFIDKVRITAHGDISVSYRGNEQFELSNSFDGWKASGNDAVWVKVNETFAKRLKKEARENPEIEFLDDEV